MSRAMRSTNPVSPLLASYLPLPSCDGSLNYSAVVIAVLIKFIVHRHFQVSDMKWGELMEQTWKTGNGKWHAIDKGRYGKKNGMALKCKCSEWTIGVRLVNTEVEMRC